MEAARMKAPAMAPMFRLVRSLLAATIRRSLVAPATAPMFRLVRSLFAAMIRRPLVAAPPATAQKLPVKAARSDSKQFVITALKFVAAQDPQPRWASMARCLRPATVKLGRMVAVAKAPKSDTKVAPAAAIV